MKPDLYTKAVLTVIAVMLTVIASKQFISPSVTVNAQSSTTRPVSFAVGPTGAYFVYDPSQSKVSIYGADGNPKSTVHLGY